MSSYRRLLQDISVFKCVISRSWIERLNNRRICVLSLKAFSNKLHQDDYGNENVVRKEYIENKRAERIRQLEASLKALNAIMNSPNPGYGRGTAFTQGQRYISLSRLEKGPKTTAGLV